MLLSTASSGWMGVVSVAWCHAQLGLLLWEWSAAAAAAASMSCCVKVMGGKKGFWHGIPSGNTPWNTSQCCNMSATHFTKLRKNPNKHQQTPFKHVSCCWEQATNTATRMSNTHTHTHTSHEHLWRVEVEEESTAAPSRMLERDKHFEGFAPRGLRARQTPTRILLFPKTLSINLLLKLY